MAKADCPQCNGTGWRLVPRAEQGPSSGRPAVFAVPCDCAAEDRATHVLDRARIPHRYRHCDFENFDSDLQFDQDAEASFWNRSLAQAKLAVEAFARDYPVDIEHGLLLMGPCGVGKTHLAVAGLKEIVRRGHQGLFYDYSELLKEIQASYNPEHPATEMGVLEPVLEAEVLLLDDLGASKPSLWALETIGHILNTRYNANRLTIITTNYLDPEFKKLPDNEAAPPVVSPRGKDGPPGSMSVVRLPSGELMRGSEEETLEKRIGKHIRSRLYEMCRTVEIVAPDYRKGIRQARRFHA